MAALPPRPVLLQMARRDFYVPVMAGHELRAAAGDDGAASIRLESYDAEHDMTDPAALADRMAFLAEALGLAGESERSATIGR
jgi:dienelactone hydrolase